MIKVTNEKLNKQIKHYIPSALVPYSLAVFFNNSPRALIRR